MAFLGLVDLIRSKETEREDDWRDAALLEEIADERCLRSLQDEESATAALQELRGRHGFEHARAAGLLSRLHVLAAAARAPRNVMAAAFLAPYEPRELPWPPHVPPPVLEVGSRLRDVRAGSARHLALVEAVRRL